MISGPNITCAAETSPNQTAVAEQLAYLIRRGVGGNVKIFWLFAKQQVADAAADQPIRSPPC